MRISRSIRIRRLCSVRGSHNHFRPGDENESEVKEESVMEAKNNNISDLSPSSVGSMDSEADRKTVHRRPVGLTITAEKLDCVLADVQTQIETLRQMTINLRLARVRLVGMEATWRSERTRPPSAADRSLHL